MRFYHGGIGGTPGTIYAGAFTNVSSRGEKKDIRPLSECDGRAWLNRVGNMKPVRYLYKGEGLADPGQKSAPGTRKSLRLGFIAEDLPEEVLDSTGQAVDLYALTTTAICAVKELKKQNEEQQKVIDSLQRRIEQYTAEAK